MLDGALFKGNAKLVAKVFSQLQENLPAEYLMQISWRSILLSFSTITCLRKKSSRSLAKLFFNPEFPNRRRP